MAKNERWEPDLARAYADAHGTGAFGEAYRGSLSDQAHAYFGQRTRDATERLQRENEALRAQLNLPELDHSERDELLDSMRELETQLSRETRRRIAAEQAWQRWIDGHQIEGDYFVNAPGGDVSDGEG